MILSLSSKVRERVIKEIVKTVFVILEIIVIETILKSGRKGF